MKREIFFRLAASAAAVAIISACGGGKEVTVKVGAISNGAATRSGRSVAGDAVQSTTEFGFAKVDGIKLTLNSLQTVNGSNNTDVIKWSPGKEITIAPGANNTLAVNETAKIPAGTYGGLKVRYANSYSVKAFCRTATKFVYTTAAGVTSVAVGTVTSTLPSDYDFFAYPFAETSTATSATGGNPETMAETDGTFTIAEGGTLSLAVLFDPSYLVTCYDGTTTVGSSNTISPFNWSNNNGVATTSFFPNASPNFGMGYVPIFIWLSTDASEALPTAETYASSTTAGNVNGASINFKNVNVTSFGFRADGTLFDTRTRIASGGNGVDLYQFFSDFSKTASTYGMKNGEWYCDAGYTNCRTLQDRSVTGFTRTTDFTSTSSSTFGDGPDCGKTLTDPSHPEWGNRARACLGASQPMTWRQLVR